LLSLLRTCASTVESLPPLVPIAIFYPGLNSALLMMVWCTSV